VYRVELRQRVQRQLDAFPERDSQAVLKAIENLEENPRPSGVEKIRGTELWRIRKGDYRVIYHIDDGERVVTIVRIGHRRDIYRGI
jgi:mRNA interferase RelE/StbE